MEALGEARGLVEPVVEPDANARLTRRREVAPGQPGVPGIPADEDRREAPATVTRVVDLGSQQSTVGVGAPPPHAHRAMAARLRVARWLYVDDRQGMVLGRRRA